MRDSGHVGLGTEESPIFPLTSSARTRFVLDRRGGRPRHDPWRHQGLHVEDERADDGAIRATATVFLTGRECPWRCTMCDLWQHTTVADTPPGAIPAQIAAARTELARSARGVTCLKLYNAGSFFDPRAVPQADYDAIAAQLAGLPRVIVESHPALIGAGLDRFLDALARARPAAANAPRLEVAMGLESAHPGVLDRLNKGLTLDGFAAASAALGERGVALRVFLLVAPPFLEPLTGPTRPDESQDAWLLRSIDTAFACGATVVSLIPTRSGNGAMEALEAAGLFRPPTLTDIERSAALALDHASHRGRIFMDAWDLDRFAGCRDCLAARRARLVRMNLEQRVLPLLACPSCQ